jgi:enamine deaminase RidA (YjgF/YER057c/UK114 family)
MFTFNCNGEVRVVDEREAWKPHKLGHYSLGRWAGNTLYMAGIVAADAATGKFVRGYEDLKPDVAERFRTGHISVDLREGPIVAQTWKIFELLKEAVEREGLTLDHVVKITPYFTDLRNFPGYHRVRKAVFPNNPPAITVVEVTGLLPSADTLIEIDAIVYRDLPREMKW